MGKYKKATLTFRRNKILVCHPKNNLISVNISAVKSTRICKVESNSAKAGSYISVRCSVTKSCPVLCDPMDFSTPGFPVLCYLLEFAQTHVH